MTHLYIFQIGPVQSFIASARRTQDLYVGSRMLSVIAAAGVIEASRSAGFQPIFPMIADGHLSQGVPHRFAFIADGDPEEIAGLVEGAVMGTWQTQFVDKVHDWLVNQIGGGEWESVYQRQTDRWLEFNWTAVPYNANDHIGSYQQASHLLAARRNMRTFAQVEEDGHKCTLTGAQSQLPLDWKKFHRLMASRNALRENEKLGAIALIKRFAGHNFARCEGIRDENFPSTDNIAGVEEPTDDKYRGKEVTGYIAVLHMDGDRMGVRISGCKTLEEHQDFSTRLAQFADNEVPAIINQYDRRDGKRHAKLIYAGGDDVLALLPLNVALACADDLRRRFAELTKCTASAGIAVTPYNLPLDNALTMARAAEKTAKEGYGRNAVVITEAHGTGQQRESGAQWEIAGQSIVEIMSDVQAHIEKGHISGKIGYEIAEIARQLVPEKADTTLNQILRPAREADLKRLISRRVTEEVRGKEAKEAIVSNLHKKFVDLGESKECGWESLANWIIYARFLASEGKVS